MSTDGAPQLEDHLVVFLDFLGTSDAVEDAARSAALLNLLVQLAGFRGEFALHVEKKPDGSIHSNVRPAVASFSDHIVIAFPLAQAREMATDERSAIGFSCFSSRV